MTLLASLRAQRLAGALREARELHAADPQVVEREQLRRLNDGWAGSLARSPWARALRQGFDLPERFGDWGEFTQAVPVLRRADLRPILEQTAAADEAVDWRATGGTTGEPFRFPVLRSEAAVAACDIWLGRGWHGVAPQDRLFMIWGHAHLFGTGLKGWLARRRRQIADNLLGYTRWSAYRLGPDDLKAAAEALLKRRARYVVGYASALDRFARANAGRTADFAGLGLKAVIATAEGFPQADSRDAIAGCFGCPVVMEYGSVETGPIAYERPAGGYGVFWPHHRLELLDQAGADGARELVVTSLYPRALPLLRYAIGDLARPLDGQAQAVTAFASVVGRCNEVISLPDGTPVHSEAFTHVIRDVSGVRAFQIVRRAGQPLPLIRVEADRPLADDALALVRRRLAQIDPGLAEIGFEWTQSLPRSTAGKHRMVVEEP
jgi:phenylacetate-coenzyme A ligase PaaK-like adenylate-forming protein